MAMQNSAQQTWTFLTSQILRLTKGGILPTDAMTIIMFVKADTEVENKLSIVFKNKFLKSVSKVLFNVYVWCYSLKLSRGCG